MEAYVTETAEEGEAMILIIKWPGPVCGCERVDEDMSTQETPLQEAPYPATLSQQCLLLSVLLVRNLNSDDQAIVLKALRLAPEGQLRRDGLRALSSLLVHGNNKVMAAVSTQLRSLSLGPAFRERVRV